LKPVLLVGAKAISLAIYYQVKVGKQSKRNGGLITATFIKVKRQLLTRQEKST
jgi:hypothetical protein